jgi:hypothetical protein
MSKINEKRYGVIGTIGNGSELLAVPRKEPKESFHLMRQTRHGDDEEIAIRYSYKSVMEVYGDLYDLDCGLYVTSQPIFRQDPKEQADCVFHYCF